MNTRKQMRIDDFYTDFSQEEERKLFEQVLLEFQADNNLPDTFIERKSTYRLLHLAHSMAIDVDPLPSRQTLGGKALGRYAVACENIERAHLLGCMLWLYANGAGDEEMKEEGWDIGASVTDNAGQCGRARRILSLRWPQVAFSICFAHDLNNLVKNVLESGYSTVAKERLMP
ncbi:hypothetical protein F441_08519 [Phytophthora nicotianae CJ01A1]|uniref:DUF659 domain-containing protein n=2 Tax=Phytophthora nicotianae TaxID=4792 RepID=W2X4T3_PHYNI|nr:hypothetical protein F441_08519 [Phytophthora nicotianae CJ01A1]